MILKNPSARCDIGILIPDGVGVRNFVLGPFLNAARQVGTLHVLHRMPTDLVDTFREHTAEDIQWHELKDHRERPFTFLLRNSLVYSQTYWIDNYPMRFMRNRPVKRSFASHAAHRVARMIGYAAAFPAGIQMLDRLHAAAVSRVPEVAECRKFLSEINPSILFCSHQRPNEILPPVLAARSLGIPTATFIFSWDNLTSKGRIAAPFDHFLVWSAQMRKELLQYYPDVTEDRVHIVGTPQFDPYGDEKVLWSREEFFQRIGGDPNRKLICYSGGDKFNGVSDPQHLRILLQAIADGKIKGNPQILLRPAPVDEGSRFEQLTKDFPDLIVAQPKWVHSQSGHWALVVPLPEDIEMLANVTHHSDMNVNFGSTMTLDFAVHDKPVVNLAFDTIDPPPFGMSLWDYLNAFDHYRPVIEMGAARFARSPEELIQHVNDYLADPSLDRAGRRAFAEFEVGVPVGRSSETIVEVLQELATRSAGVSVRA